MESEVPKGKTFGVWLTGKSLAAFDAMKRNRPDLRAGTYCTEAVEQRLAREGYLKADRAGEIAAMAAELVKKLGAGPVEAKLGELADAVANSEPASLLAGGGG